MNKKQLESVLDAELSNEEFFLYNLETNNFVPFSEFDEQVMYMETHYISNEEEKDFILECEIFNIIKIYTKIDIIN